MNINSRTKNTLLNLISNFIYQIIVLLITFLSRRIFIKNLGIDFLGISGLFSNILELFTLAELGISSAISFSMYKYIANRDEKKLKELTTYYKVLYNRIAVFVLIIGIILFPFLKYIINLENNVDNIEIMYLIFLANSVLSYLFIYKTTIVTADQSEYKMKSINVIIEIVKVVLQILSMVIFKDYILYIMIQLVCTLIGNIIKSKLAEKWYPFIKEEATLPSEERKELWSDIKSMSLYKFGAVAMNHTDNILISMFVSTTMVGIYSNYTMLYTKISSFINLLFSSIMASVGSLNVSSSADEKYRIYKLVSFVSYILFAIACIGIWFVADDVIRILSDSSRYIMDKSVLVLIIVNYYLMGLLNPNIIFRQTSGLFKYAKYSMLICSVLNIVLSVILGYYFGIFGIIFASIISRLLTNIWYEPYLLYTKFFHKNPKEYYIRELMRALLLILIIVALTPIIGLICFDNAYIRIVIKSFICSVIPLFIFVILFRKTEEYVYIIQKLKIILKKLKGKFEI